MTTEKIAEIFDVEPHEVETGMGAVVIPAGTDATEDVDFDAARANTYELIDMSKASLHTAMKVAAETDNPRALEVVGQLLKTASEINRQLIIMNKDKAEVKAVKNGKMVQGALPNQVTNNAVFVGSSASLNKMLNDHLKP